MKKTYTQSAEEVLRDLGAAVSADFQILATLEIYSVRSSAAVSAAVADGLILMHRAGVMMLLRQLYFRLKKRLKVAKRKSNFHILKAALNVAVRVLNRVQLLKPAADATARVTLWLLNAPLLV